MGAHAAGTVVCTPWLVDPRNTSSASMPPSTGCLTRWAAPGPLARRPAPTSCASAFPSCSSFARLKYALTNKEVQKILMQRLVKVDGKVRTDINYPVGFMDVVSIEKSDEHFRLLYDAKGRFVLHRLNNKNFSKESEFKLCRVQAVRVGAKGVPCITTHDGRTIRYPDPLAKLNDVIKVDIATGKCVDVVKFEVGATCVITKGQNQGRIGT